MFMFPILVLLWVPYFAVNKQIISFNDVYFSFINFDLIFTYGRIVWW